MSVGTSVNWSGIAVVVASIATAASVVIKWLTTAFANAEKARKEENKKRKQELRKARRRQEAKTRQIVEEVLADHMGAEIQERQKAVAAAALVDRRLSRIERKLEIDTDGDPAWIGRGEVTLQGA